MDIPDKVQQLADLLQSKGFSPVGYAEVDEGYIVQISESG